MLILLPYQCFLLLESKGFYSQAYGSEPLYFKVTQLDSSQRVIFD